MALFQIDKGEQSTEASSHSKSDGTGSASDTATNFTDMEHSAVNGAREHKNGGHTKLHKVGEESGADGIPPNGAEDLVNGTEAEAGAGDVEAVRTLIVLFDNTYSWYKPKEIK